MPGKMRFYLKVAVAMAVFLGLIGIASATYDRVAGTLGGWGWLPWVLGLLTLMVALLIAWGTAISWLDAHALRKHALAPGESPRDGATVAVSGVIRSTGPPLKAPFSGKACIAYWYQVCGRRRSHSGDSNQDRQQLGLHGFALVPAGLDTPVGRFAIGALPDVDADYREMVNGGPWSQVARDLLEQLGDETQRLKEDQSRGRHIEMQQAATAPVTEHHLVSLRALENTPNLDIIEDAVPADTPVTILARFDGQDQALVGRTLGTLKVFQGPLDERLQALKGEYRKGATITTVLFLVCVALWAVPTLIG